MTGKTELNEFLIRDKEKQLGFCHDTGTWNAQLRPAPDTPHVVDAKVGKPANRRRLCNPSGSLVSDPGFQPLAVPAWARISRRRIRQARLKTAGARHEDIMNCGTFNIISQAGSPMHHCTASIDLAHCLPSPATIHLSLARADPAAST